MLTGAIHPQTEKPMKKRIEELDKSFAASSVTNASALTWRSGNDARFTVRGLGWFEENERGWARLPHRAKGVVREPVWDLAQCPASARIVFRSDTTAMAVRVTNASAVLMNHMAPTGSNGVALYCGEPGRMRYWATARPELDTPAFESLLVEKLPRKMREFRLYLPLYMAMQSIEIGLSKGARVRPPSPPAVEKPVVVYGTSITQGGCASTPGSDFVSTVGRMLNLNVVNLGFSGNGIGEPELAELVAELDASLYVLDYVSNADHRTFHKNLQRFYRMLRERRPTTPMLLVTPPCFAGQDWNHSRKETVELKRDVMIGLYARERKRGDRNLHLCDGYGLIPFGTDAAYVDGVHPTSHGFAMMAERLAPFIEHILLRDS
jgi:lysophospholipase L1-like esterase